jgi:hypothetical protein
MNRTENTVKKVYEQDSASAELGLVVQRMSERENDERGDKLTKRYTGSQDDKDTEAYQLGYSDGYRDGSLDSWGKGFDEGLKQAAQEQKDKETEEELG